MASSATAVSQAGQEQQFLTFFLGGEEYAVSILRVKEIIEFDSVTKVPSTPPWIRGVINLRGSVVPVVDLSVKFGLGETKPTKLTCIVVVESQFEGQQTITGVMADAVSQVAELKPEDVEPVPSFGTNVRVDYLLGMGKAGKKFVMLLDIDRILASSELLGVGESGAGEAPAPESLQAGSEDAGSEDAASEETAPEYAAEPRRRRRKETPDNPS